MLNEIPIDEILAYSESEYSEYISKLLKEDSAFYLIDEIDDYLQKIVESAPEKVEGICKLNASIYKTTKSNKILSKIIGYNYNTYLISLIYQGNIKGSKEMFLEAIAYCQERKHYEAGKSLSQNVIRLFNNPNIPNDEIMYILSRITQFYNSLKKYQDSIEVLCAAAHHFSDVSAFQSANRAINDAQEIANSHYKFPHTQILIRETQGMVALLEGDHDCAEIEFQNCFNIYEQLNETPTLQLRVNAATVKLRKNDFIGAKTLYEALKDTSEGTHNFQIKTNLLVCYRELGEIKLFELLSSEIESNLVSFELDHRIEARLVLAKSYFHFTKIKQGKTQLTEACIDVQKKINQYQRLHYRRGIREQYLPRIKTMLCEIEASGKADEIIYALTFCFGNAVFDWMSVLDWYDEVNSLKDILSQDKQELSIKLKNLINFGTPFLYGFREKYDDPFEQSNDELQNKIGLQAANALDYSLPWREFNDFTSRISQTYSIPAPFDNATIQKSTDLINSAKSGKTAFLFSLACQDKCIVFFVYKDKYLKDEFPLEDLLQFSKAIYNYQRGISNRAEFMTALSKFELSIKPTLRGFLDEFLDANLNEFVFIPDSLTESMPILSIILENDRIRVLAKDLKFNYRTCASITREILKTKHNGQGVFISNSDEDLELCVSEKAVIRDYLQHAILQELDLTCDNLDFSSNPLKEAEFIHMSTHSVPANVFTDPMFISTSIETSKKGIWLEFIQRESFQLNLSFVFLNGCNTAATANRNYFKGFSTSERTGLSSAFLLNRHCTVIGTQWNEPEIVSYIFTALFYKRLQKQPSAVNTFILSVVDLYELTKNATIELLMAIEDSTIRDQKINLIERTNTDFPFRSVYTLGMFQCYSLIPFKTED
jgi:hypothetical protein